MAEAKQLVEQRCRSLITQLQTMECDAVGFGQQLRRQHLQHWNKLDRPWQDVFRNYPVQVEVTVKNVIWGRIWSEEGIVTGKEAPHGT